MTAYVGYSRKGLKRQISSRKYWRVFNNDERIRRTVKTYFKFDREIMVGCFTHNGYVYCQEVVVGKDNSYMVYYKVSMLKLTGVIR